MTITGNRPVDRMFKVAPRPTRFLHRLLGATLKGEVTK